MTVDELMDLLDEDFEAFDYNTELAIQRYKSDQEWADKIDREDLLLGLSGVEPEALARVESRRLTKEIENDK